MKERSLLLLIGRIFCICPSYDTARRKLTHVYAWKVYQLLIFGGIFCLDYKATIELPHGMGSNSYFAKHTDPFETLINVASQYIIYFMYIVNVFRLILTDTKKWADMFTNLAYVEEALMTNKLSKTTNLQYILQYTSRLIFLDSMLIMLAVTSEPLQALKYFSYEGLQLAGVSFLLVMIDYISIAVHTNFDVMNQHISKSISGPEILTPRKYMKIYIKLYNVIEYFNDIFGWEIVLMNILAMMSSLPALKMILTLNADPFFILYASWSMGLCMMTTKRCHNATKEGLKFIELSFEKSHALPISSTNEELVDDWKQLRALCSEFKPVFSAAGVFEIDYSVLYILFTLIMSYLAILVQFQAEV